MADYTWQITGPEDRELAGALGRRIDFAVDAPAVARFQLDGYGEEAAAIESFGTDLVVYRDGTKIFRGRITSEQDQISASNHVASFSAVDYRGLLSHRLVDAVLTWSAIDQGTIAWDLVDHTQGKSEGDLGITQGLGTTSGTTRDRTIEVGTKIGEAITSLGRLQNGFEWTINPDLELDRWYPRRGADDGVQLDYGGLITSLTRTLTPAEFANVVVVGGSNETTPVQGEKSGSYGNQGRWEQFRGYPTIKEQDTLDDRADWLLSELALVKPGYACQVTPGAWEGPNHLWIGDTVGLQVTSGRLAVDVPQRVVTLGLEVTDSDNEVLYLGLIDTDTY